MPDAADRRIAAALAGEAQALDAVAREDADGALARRHRIGPALYFAASAGGTEGPGVGHKGLRVPVEKVGAEVHLPRFLVDVDADV